MFRTTHWWAVLLTVGLLAAGGGQALASGPPTVGPGAGETTNVGGPDYAPPDWQLPFPLGSTRPEDGGFYAGLEWVFWRQTNPIEDQVLAVRGFLDVDGSATAAAFPQLGTIPGTFYGSSRPALDASQVSGPNRYSPGFRVELGWKFADASAFSVGWLYLFNQKRTAVATLVPPGYAVGGDLADTFLFSPVFNYPGQYAGPGSDVVGGGAFSAYGIWNAADVMTIDFEQKFQRWEATYRQTLIQDDCFRLSGLVGPRFSWIWERFRWRTTDADLSGGTDPSWMATYTAIVSNRMYGVHTGYQFEYYLGHGFACMFEGQASGYLNIVKERAKYELGAKLPPANKRALTDYTFVPELTGNISLMWYPTEGVQFKLGYDVLVFFNTVSTPRPVDFNYSSVQPEYSTSTVRFFDGITASIAMWF